MNEKELEKYLKLVNHFISDDGNLEEIKTYIANVLYDVDKNYKQEIEKLKKENKILRENAEHNDKVVDKVNWENNILKHRLNDIVFDDANEDVELGARYLRKIGYIDFDEERKVYVNKHNNEPFIQDDEREKDYYIPDEELDEYTKQLECKLQQKENILKEVREYVNKMWLAKLTPDTVSQTKFELEEMLEKEVN